MLFAGCSLDDWGDRVLQFARRKPHLIAIIITHLRSLNDDIVIHRYFFI